MKWYILFFIIFVLSCKEKKKDNLTDTINAVSDLIKVADQAFTDTNTVIKEYIETEKGDSIVFYADFDFFAFKGINRYKKFPDKYPYTKLIYNKNQVTLKACYSSSGFSQLKYKKIKGHWIFSTSHWDDGETLYFYTTSVNHKIVELTYTGNVFGDDCKGLRKIEFTYPTGGKILSNLYYLNTAFEKNTLKFPDLNSISEKEIARNSIRALASYAVFEKDSLKTTFYDANPITLEPLEKPLYITLHSYINSYFYTHISHIYGSESSNSFLRKAMAASEAYDSLIRK